MINLTVTRISGEDAVMVSVFPNDTVMKLRLIVDNALGGRHTLLGPGGTEVGDERDIASVGLVDGGTVQAILAPIPKVASNTHAFAIITSEGAVVTQGDPIHGGDSSSVIEHLQSGVQHICSTGLSFGLRAKRGAFAALKADGSVVTWGDSRVGGDSDAVKDELESGVQNVYSTSSAFAALKSDGSVVTWGRPHCGGDSDAVKDEFESGVQNVYSTSSAFAALKSDGSVVTWGGPNRGGDSDAVKDEFESGVQHVYSICGNTFAAVQTAGHVVAWGYMARTVSEALGPYF